MRALLVLVRGHYEQLSVLPSLFPAIAKQDAGAKGIVIVVAVAARRGGILMLKC